VDNRSRKPAVVATLQAMNHPNEMNERRWAHLAARQDGMLSIRQLAGAGVPRAAVRHRLSTGHWVRRTEHVVSTTTGELSPRQRLWLGVLHAGNDSVVGGLSAAAFHGLRGWDRPLVTVLVHAEWSFEPVDGTSFFRTRRPLADFRGTPRGTLPVCALEPAVLLFAAYERNRRTAQGVLAAVVQQRLTTADSLSRWLERMRPLRRAREFRRVLIDIEGGAHSVAEIDVRRMCRRYGLPLPGRQRERRDRQGRGRFTDCEWRLPGNRVLVLEVDGGFHADVEHYDADMRRQRKITTFDRIVLRCGAAELRDDPGSVAEDLIALGVESCAPAVAGATVPAHDRDYWATP
jgi:hypothetical protein